MNQIRRKRRETKRTEKEERKNKGNKETIIIKTKEKGNDWAPTKRQQKTKKTNLTKEGINREWGRERERERERGANRAPLGVFKGGCNRKENKDGLLTTEVKRNKIRKEKKEQHSSRKKQKPSENEGKRQRFGQGARNPNPTPSQETSKVKGAEVRGKAG